MIKEFNLDDYRLKLKQLAKDKLTFGINYLDKAAGGILKTDFIIISAHTGLGKTELASAISFDNAYRGNNVYYFALEAFKYEIEARNVFKLATKMFYNDYKYNSCVIFQDYIDGKLPENFLRYVEDAENAIRVLSNNLHIKYRENENFTIEDFEKDLMQIDLKAKLIVIDHLHFFDYDEQKEYSAISRIVKRLRDLAQITEIPIVLVSHLRKNNYQNQRLIPSIDDLHGSSNISKVASKVILISPDFQHENNSNYEFPTLFRVAKNRYNGAVQRFVGVLNYDIRTNSYSEKYEIGKLNFLEIEYNIVTEKPIWSTK